MTNKEWLSRQKKYSGGYLFLSVALGVLNGLFLILQAWFLAKIVDNVIFHQGNLQQNMFWMWALLAIFLIRAVITWLSEQAAFNAAIQVKQQIRSQLFSHLQSLGPVVLSKHPTGELINTLSEGIEALEDYFARFLPAISLMALLPMSILCFVFPMDWKSALIFFFTAPLIPLFMIFIGKKAEQLNQKQWYVMARMTAYFLDTIQGLTTLKIFNASRKEADVIVKISDEYRHATMKVLRVAFLSSFVLEFFSTISIAIVAVLIGFRLYWGEMDFLYGFFILLLAPEFYLPLRNMGTHYHARMKAIGAADKIIELFSLEEGREQKDLSPEIKLSSHLNIDIEFKNVDFHYQEEQFELKNINLRINSGQSIAIIGYSGSGKTSIINLLMGFIQPTKGNIYINQQPLSSISTQDWHQNIAWMPQKAHLFYGTIAENICLGQVDINHQEMLYAARNAGADDFIQQLPEAYDTRVGEQGFGLSGGQIQRIALARAFYKKASLLVLDEATANLDLESEQQVKDGIELLKKNATVIIIAHRLSTIINADQVVVVNNGRIVQHGVHDDLIHEPGQYQAMFRQYSAKAGIT